MTVKGKVAERSKFICDIVSRVFLRDKWTRAREKHRNINIYGRKEGRWRKRGDEIQSARESVC